jgi:hypothetical protein
LANAAGAPGGGLRGFYESAKNVDYYEGEDGSAIERDRFKDEVNWSISPDPAVNSSPTIHPLSPKSLYSTSTACRAASHNCEPCH